MRQPEHPHEDDIRLIDVLGALSDPVRVGLLQQLSDRQEHGWGELRAPVAKSTLSHHLRILRDAGITWTRQDGTRCFVRLRHTDLDAQFPGLLDAVLDAADREGER